MNNKKEKIPLKGGEEHDFLTNWKQVHNNRNGGSKKAKKKYNKRLRHFLKKELGWKAGFTIVIDGKPIIVEKESAMLWLT
jgi:hypothetical protein